MILKLGSVKGVDSTASSSSAVAHAARIARDYGCVVAVSGEVDYVSAGPRGLSLEGFHWRVSLKTFIRAFEANPA